MFVFISSFLEIALEIVKTNFPLIQGVWKDHPKFPLNSEDLSSPAKRTCVKVQRLSQLEKHAMQQEIAIHWFCVCPERSILFFLCFQTTMH